MSRPFSYNSVLINSTHSGIFQWPEFRESILDLSGTGVDRATLFVQLTQDSPNASRIDRNSIITESDESIVAAVNSLREAGLSATLMLGHGWLNEGRYSWQGAIQPDDATAWFASFTEQAVHYGRLAESLDIDTLVLGQELVRLTGKDYRAQWTALIDSVREVFDGRVAYGVHASSASEWSGDEIYTVSFVDRLDLVGINLYPSLVAHAGASVDEMVAGWYADSHGVDLVELIRSFQRSVEKPIFFSEIGVGSFSGAAIKANTFVDQISGNYVPDETEQRNFLDAFFEVWSREGGTWLEGFAWWEWPPVDRAGTHGGWLGWAVDHGIQDKLAETALTEWMAGLRQGQGLVLAGTPESDWLEGSYHHDSFFASPGDDQVWGGAGFDQVIYPGPRASYSLTQQGIGTLVFGESGTDRLEFVERLRFDDLSVNLEVGPLSRTLDAAAVNSLIELYIAYIGRIPEADGMQYWLQALAAGRSLESIGDAFFDAALAYPELTGYRADMTNRDFVQLVYGNVLGRAEPDLEGLAYWSGLLNESQIARADLVRQMLESAHTFKGDPAFGWVADLLDNRIAVGRHYAIEHAITHDDPVEAIRTGIEIANAVTPFGIDAATSYYGSIGDIMLI